MFRRPEMLHSYLEPVRDYTYPLDIPGWECASPDRWPTPTQATFH